MNIDEIEKNVEQIEECIAKMKNLISDIKLCLSDVSKSILYAALKKFSSTISEFKID